MFSFFGIFLSLILFSGFYFLGKISINFFKLKKIIEIVSEPGYQYSSIGIAFFIFCIYPFFFLEIFNKEFFFFIAILVLSFGSYQIIKNLNSIILNLKREMLNLKKLSTFQSLFYLFFILYLIITLCPPSSGDTVAYHLSLSKYILENGFLPKNYFDFEAKLFGSGELFNSFALSINAFQFTSLLQFIGLLSIFGILKKNCIENNLNDKSKITIYLFLFSCPMLIFLLASSKPQFFFVSLTVFCLIYLFKIKESFNSKTIFKIFILCNILLLTALSAKINFTLSLIIFNFIYFYYFLKKKIIFKPIFFTSILFCFSLLPVLFWKSEFYNLSFYSFLTNPLPINMPGYEEYYLYLKNYDSEKFPWLFFFPSSLGSFTNTLGLSALLIFYLIFINYSGRIKFIIIFIFFLIFMIFFGQKSPRFFLEIYILFILLLPKIYKNISKNKIFIILKPLIFLQSFVVAISLIWGIVSLFPASLNSNLNDKILSKYADGYLLYNWVNTVLPKKAKIIVDHRSTFFLDTTNYMNTSALTSIGYDDFKGRQLYLEDIKMHQPEYILFRGNSKKLSYGEFDFEKCLDKLFAKSKNVGKVVSRNPFNISSDRYYDAYIYKLNYKKFPNCVKRSKK